MRAYADPESWLKRINFFATLLEQMARVADIKSVHCINYSGALTINRVEYHFLKQTTLQLTIPVGLHNYILMLNPDVVIVHGLLYSWQTLWLRWQLPNTIPIVVQHHSETPLRHYRSVLQKIADRFVDAYFFPSLEQVRPWVDRRQIKSIEKVYEVMEVPSVFHPVERELARSMTKVVSSIVYLWVGRFDENKDPITLIKAFIPFARNNSSVSLYVIYQRDELIEHVKKLFAEAPDVSGRIFLVGKVDHDQLLHWFNSADFIISTSHYEGMGVAVTEAMSCGCIPILSDIPSFRRMTNSGECGLLFKAGDVTNLETTLNKSLSLDLPVQKEKTLTLYRDNLSAEAISNRMLSVIAKVCDPTRNKKV
jgi:glycosyltransferase involved in cell wall biosynthesis